MLEKDLVLFDGNCNMCKRMVNWCHRHDTQQRLDFVPSQIGPAFIMTPEMIKAAELAVHVVTTEGRTLRAGRAVLYILGRLGWTRTERFFSWGPILAVVEFFYGIVARNRIAFSKVLFKGQTTFEHPDYVPPPDDEEAGVPEGTPASRGRC